MYDKLAGMTGTAETEATEFEKIYKLDVIVIPTNQELIRHEFPDLVYRSEREKFKAVAEEVKELNELGRPVLMGTTSIEKSERLSGLLKRRGIKHVVLNAKYHEREAEIVAQAGKIGAVTIATNMAGRGTDIILGGNHEFQAKTQSCGLERVRPRRLKRSIAKSWRSCFRPGKRSTIRWFELGGCHIIGTERHESRRIDNQLRGRSGRQGDPGSSRFYLSLEDDLMRIFGSDNISGLMHKLGMEEGSPHRIQVDHPADRTSPKAGGRQELRDQKTSPGV